MDQQTLVSLYEKILTSLNCSQTDGYLRFGHGSDAGPLICEDKRMVLPTREILETMDRTACVAFHPLCESSVRGESAIIRKLRALVNTQLTYALGELMNHMLGIAMDTARHSALSPDQKDFITIIPDIPDDCHTQFMTIMKLVDAVGENRIVNVYIKRAPTLDGVGYKRGAIIAFPLLAELERTDDKVFGKTIKKKNKAVLLKLLRYILDEAPDTNAAELYSCGSNSVVAPNFHCLMLTFAKTMRRFNSLIWEYRGRIPSYKDIHVKLDWVSEIKDLTIYKGLLPVLAGNDGEVVANAAAEEPVATKPSQPMVNRSVVAAAALSGSVAAVSAGAAPVAAASAPAVVTPIPARSSAPVDEVASWTSYIVGSRNTSVPTTLPLVGRGVNAPQPQYPQQQYPQYPQPIQQQVPTVTYPLTNGRNVTVAAPIATHAPQVNNPVYPGRGGYQTQQTSSRFGI